MAPGGEVTTGNYTLSNIVANAFMFPEAPDKGWLRRRKLDRFSMVYLGFFIAVALYVAIVLCFDPFPQAEPYDPFYAPSIGAIAAIIAIAMSISIFVIQHAASIYTPSILERYRDDLKFWSTFSFGAFAILLLVVDLLSSWDAYALHPVLLFCTLVLVMIFFRYTLRKIDPLTIVADVRADMVGRCRKILKSSRAMPQASMEDVIRSPQSAGPHSDLMSYRSDIRQIALMSASKGDYSTCRVCFDTCGEVFEEYMKIAAGHSWDSDEFTRTLMSDMDSYWTRGLDDDRDVLSGIIRTYERMGIASIKYTVWNTLIAGKRNRFLDDIADSLEKMGTELAGRSELRLVGELVRCMRRVAVKGLEHSDSVPGMLGSISRISDSAIRKNSDIGIPLVSIVESLGIVEGMIYRSLDADSVKRGIRGLHETAEGLGTSVGGYTIDYGVAREVLREMAGCVVEAVRPSAAKRMGWKQEYPGYKRAVILALIDLAFHFAVPSSRNGNKPVSSAVMRWLVLVIWMLVTAQSRAGNGAYEEEIGHAIDRAEGILGGMGEVAYEDVADASVVALYCSLYLQGSAVAKGARLIRLAAQKSAKRDSFDLALVALDLVGSRTVGGGDEGGGATSEGVARHWMDLVKEYRREFREEPEYDAPLTAQFLFPSYAEIRRQFLPERRMYVSMGRDAMMSDMFSKEGLEGFAKVRGGLGRRARHRLRPARRRARATPAVHPAAPPQDAPDPVPARRPRPAGRPRTPAKRSPVRRGSRARRPPASPRRPARSPSARRPARRRAARPRRRARK